MKLPNHVKVKRFPWTLLPLFSTATAHAIYPYIYIPQKLYVNLQLDNPDPKNVAVLIHEQTHIQRQKKMGWLLWELTYCFSGKFRMKEEIAAITASMKYYKKEKLVWDTQKSALFLSSYLYLWCTSYHNAKEKLDETWSAAFFGKLATKE